MTTDEIVKGNKLIAEFMGWHFEPAFSDVNTTRYDRWITPYSPAWATAEQMAFHSSWDWLMPVVEKISEIDNQAGEEMAAHMRNAALDDLAILNTSILCHKDEVYKRVVAYIKWYNQ